MRRALGCLLIAGLLLGAAACGSSGGSDSSSTKTTSASGSGGGSTSSSNKDVQAYCKAVDAYVAKVKAAEGDASKVAALTSEDQDLGKKASALATSGLSASDASAVAACTKKSTEALLPGN